MHAVRKQQPLEKNLKEIYFNAQHPASFGGVKRLAEAVQKKPKEIQSFLNQQWTYQFHKPIQYKFTRRRYMSRGINEQWQADLVEMQHYSKQNQGYRYILCVIDIFSRFAYARPLLTKSGPDVSQALSDIFEKSGVVPKYLQTDQGKEFYNRYVQELLEKHNVELFSVYSEKKAAIVERFQRTLQERMYRAFTYQGNHQWLALLPQLIESYNHAYHRSIKTMPANINKSNETDIWLRQYSNVEKNPKCKFKVGDHVRIPKQRTVFTKGYIEKWTDEEFIITQINLKYKPALYSLTDLNGEVIKGSFYEQELQKVDNPQQLYRIDRIIRKHKNKVLVQWKGYKDPSWINASELKSI